MKYFGLYFSDLLLCLVLTWCLLKLKQSELSALIKMGVFKDLHEMNDREMFQEYDKMIKQSKKVRNQYGYRKNFTRSEQSTSEDQEEEISQDENKEAMVFSLG